jgi:hypothetical protein
LSIRVVQKLKFLNNFRLKTAKCGAFCKALHGEPARGDKIAAISRDITELIDLGVELFSMQPEYYYTKLDEIKIER